MFQELEKINERPAPFEFYTAADLWADEYTSKQMLSYHLNGDIDLASRKTDFIDKSAAWIISHFRVGAGTKIADFGCGPGLYTIRLAKQGAAVTGVDFSPNSIRYAREAAEKANLPIRYIESDYLEFATDDRYDLALMIFCDYCPLSPAQRSVLLAKLHAFLEPGGALLLDVCSLPAYEKRQEAAMYELNQLNSFWSADKYYGFVNTFKYEAEKVTLDKYTLVEAGRTRTVYNWLQYFSPEMLQEELEAAGFRVEGLFANVAGEPYDPAGDEFAAVARKA